MNKKNRTKPRELKPYIKTLIYREAIRQRTVPRELLANRLIKEIKKSNEIPPSLLTTKRYISQYRNNNNPLDMPWTLGSCRDHPNSFPPNSLRFLMKMQESSKQFVDVATKRRPQGFSIRKAMWIVRLQPIVEEYFRPDTFEEQWQILSNISESYSYVEITSELMQEETFDTTDLDDAIYSRNLTDILLCGFCGIRRKSSICKEDKGECDGCKYQPFEFELCIDKPHEDRLNKTNLFKDELCQSKLVRQQQAKLEDESINGKLPQPRRKEGKK